MHPNEEYVKKQAEANQCGNTSAPQVLKDFNSCGIEEKVTRLYVIIKDLRRSLEHCHISNQNMATKLYALEHHQHSEKGDCMIRIEDTNRNGGVSIGMSNTPSTHDLLA